jgi:ankyrin repeat protein
MNQQLIEAAGKNNVPEVRRLLSAGADIGVEDDDGYTPLIDASYQGHVQVVAELLDHGADIDATNYLDCAPLPCACYNGHLAVVIELLSRGANTEATNNRGNTSLHVATIRDHLPVVKVLLSGGANMLAANNYGRLPIHCAVISGNSAVAKCLLQHFYATTRRLPIHDLLKDLTWIGDPNSNILDVPSLHLALDRNVLRTGHVVEIVEYLVCQNPALLSSRDQDGSLPLHVACRRAASFSIVQSLVNRYKVSVKRVTPQGDSPLFLACEAPGTSLGTIFLLMKLYPDLVYR